MYISCHDTAKVCNIVSYGRYKMNGYGSDACQCFDVLAEQGRASIFIDGEAGHAVDVLDVGNMQLADFFDPHAGIKRNPRCPEFGRLSFRSFQITGSVTEKRVQFGFSYHPENDGFQFFPGENASDSAQLF